MLGSSHSCLLWWVWNPARNPERSPSPCVPQGLGCCPRPSLTAALPKTFLLRPWVQEAGVWALWMVNHPVTLIFFQITRIIRLLTVKSYYKYRYKIESDSPLQSPSLKVICNSSVTFSANTTPTRHHVPTILKLIFCFTFTHIYLRHHLYDSISRPNSF